MRVSTANLEATLLVSLFLSSDKKNKNGVPREDRSLRLFREMHSRIFCSLYS